MVNSPGLSGAPLRAVCRFVTEEQHLLSYYMQLGATLISVNDGDSHKPTFVL